MSTYKELQLLVADIAASSQNTAFYLSNLSKDIEKYAASFDRLTATTQGNSAKNVEVAFLKAEKDLVVAVNALIAAANAGFEWSGSSPKEQVKVRTRIR